ncbi:MAG: ABC transporter substrate-binding protein [Litorilinea sp.]
MEHRRLTGMFGTRGTTMNRRRFLQSAGLSAGLLALAACGGNGSNGGGTPSAAVPAGETPGTAPAAAGEPQMGGTLRVAFPGTPGQLDPAQIFTNEDYHIAINTFEGLVRLDDNLVAQPELAESWTPSDDLLTWDFTLRQGVTFHHGTEFNAEDVVYTFERILDPATASPLRTVMSYLESIEALDDYQVRFHLNSANADLPAALAAVQARIVCRDQTIEQLSSEPTGTGPFRLVEYVPGDHSLLERNEDYWEEGYPYLDAVRMVYMPEQATQVAAMQGGSVDAMWQLSFENMPNVEASPGIRVIEVPSGLYQPISMQTDQEPFDNPLVREALKLCVNREGMLQVVVQGVGQVANDQPVPPVNPYFDSSIAAREQNIERAQELLAEAGYADGLDLTLYTSASRPGMVEIAVAYQEMARPAGINITIERTPPDVYWSEYWLQVPFYVSNWNLRVTADETLAIAYHSEAAWNESNYSNPELDSLIDAARGEPDEATRAELYAQAQQIISEDGGVIISHFKPVVAAARDVAHNVTPMPTALMFFRDSWLEAS